MCQKFKRDSRIPRVKRDLIVTLVFFSINISPLLPVDVGTLPNHVKSCVSWLCGDSLLVVDLLRFRFCCQVFDLVFLYCLIVDRSSTRAWAGQGPGHLGLAPRDGSVPTWPGSDSKEFKYKSTYEWGELRNRTRTDSLRFGSCVWVTHTYYKMVNPALTLEIDHFIIL